MIINTASNNILLLYKGPFYIDILANFAFYIRHISITCLKESIRLYKVYFELTQNVAKYSFEKRPIYKCKHSGVGSFCLIDKGNEIFIKTSNLIRNEDGPILREYCNNINSMDNKELHEYRSRTLKQNFDDKDIGAHVGIIQIGLLSRNKLDFEIIDIDENFSQFTIGATLTKQ